MNSIKYRYGIGQHVLKSQQINLHQLNRSKDKKQSHSVHKRQKVALEQSKLKDQKKKRSVTPTKISVKQMYAKNPSSNQPTNEQSKASTQVSNMTVTKNNSQFTPRNHLLFSPNISDKNLNLENIESLQKNKENQNTDNLDNFNEDINTPNFQKNQEHQKNFNSTNVDQTQKLYHSQKCNPNSSSSYYQNNVNYQSSGKNGHLYKNKNINNHHKMNKTQTLQQQQQVSHSYQLNQPSFNNSINRNHHNNQNPYNQSNISQCSSQISKNTSVSKNRYETQNSIKIHTLSNDSQIYTSNNFDKKNLNNQSRPSLDTFTNISPRLKITSSRNEASPFNHVQKPYLDMNSSNPKNNNNNSGKYNSNNSGKSHQSQNKLPSTRFSVNQNPSQNQNKQGQNQNNNLNSYQNNTAINQLLSKQNQNQDQQKIELQKQNMNSSYQISSKKHKSQNENKSLCQPPQQNSNLNNHKQQQPISQGQKLVNQVHINLTNSEIEKNQQKTNGPQKNNFVSQELEYETKFQDQIDQELQSTYLSPQVQMIPVFQTPSNQTQSDKQKLQLQQQQKNQTEKKSHFQYSNQQPQYQNRQKSNSNQFISVQNQYYNQNAKSSQDLMSQEKLSSQNNEQKIKQNPQKQQQKCQNQSRSKNASLHEVQKSHQLAKNGYNNFQNYQQNNSNYLNSASINNQKNPLQKQQKSYKHINNTSQSVSKVQLKQKLKNDNKWLDSPRKKSNSPQNKAQNKSKYTGLGSPRKNLNYGIQESPRKVQVNIDNAQKKVQKLSQKQQNYQFYQYSNHVIQNNNNNEDQYNNSVLSTNQNSGSNTTKYQSNNNLSQKTSQKSQKSSEKPENTEKPDRDSTPQKKLQQKSQKSIPSKYSLNLQTNQLSNILNSSKKQLQNSRQTQQINNKEAQNKSEQNINANVYMHKSQKNKQQQNQSFQQYNNFTDRKLLENSNKLGNSIEKVRLKNLSNISNLNKQNQIIEVSENFNTVVSKESEIEQDIYNKIETVDSPRDMENNVQIKSIGQLLKNNSKPGHYSTTSTSTTNKIKTQTHIGNIGSVNNINSLIQKNISNNYNNNNNNNQFSRSDYHLKNKHPTHQKQQQQKTKTHTHLNHKITDSNNSNSNSNNDDIKKSDSQYKSSLGHLEDSTKLKENNNNNYNSNNENDNHCNSQRISIFGNNSQKQNIQQNQNNNNNYNNKPLTSALKQSRYGGSNTQEQFHEAKRKSLVRSSNVMKNSVSFDNQNLVMPIENSFNQKQKRNVNPSQFDFTVGDFCFNLKDKIGSGKFSIVYKGYNITNGKRVGIKQMKQSQFQTPKMEQLLMNEIEVNRKLKSNHIVQMHDLIYQDIWIYMILELCPEGDLETYLEESGGMLDEEESLDILTQILEGLKTLIYHGYIHRDMKPANIMKKGQIYKLADFGMATKVDTAGRDFIQEQVGSPLYMAPQILQNQKYTVKSDIWSIGLIFYQMLFGKTPWPARDIQSLISAIKEIPLRFPYDYPIGEQAKHFIKGCLQIEECDRFNWEQVFSHPIFNVNNKGHLEYGYKFDDKFKNIMRDLQQAAQVKGNVKEIFENFQMTHDNKLDQDSLYQLFSRFDDLITFFESNHIFNQLKTLDFISQKEYVDSDELIRIFQEYDFVDLQDPASHILMDIKEIIKQNKYDIKSIFNVYLGQNAEKLNLTQFTKILHQFLPGLHAKEIEHCFEAFDNDNDGLISFQEFEYHLNFGITNSYKQKDKIKTKGMKIAEEIRTIIVEQNTTLKQLFIQFDHGNTRQLDFEQFKSFINYIKPEMHENDIKDLFQFFDERKTSHVSLGNLEKVINKNSSLQAKRKSIFIMH